MTLKDNRSSIAYYRQACRWSLVLVFAAMYGCGSSISTFSEYAYQKTISLKIESLALIEKSTEPYDDHRMNVESLNRKLLEAYEYAKGRPKNSITVRQWEILMSPDRNLLGGTLKRWKTDGSLNGVFVTEIKDEISDAFDTIIGLESGKIKPNEVE